MWFNARSMPEVNHPAVALVAVLAGVAIVRLQLWRAVLCLAPTSLRALPEEPADLLTVPGALEPAWHALLGLGFTAVGSHTEAPRFGRAVLLYDAVLAAQHTWASLGPRGLQLLTRTTQGFVLTTTWRRPAREVKGRYLAGCIEGATPERLLKAHLRRVAELGGPAAGEHSLDARVALTQAWLAGPGGADLRAQHVIGLLWCAGGLALIGSLFVTPR